jgi:ATP-dependent Clp protease ATP-binding subunit ClpB
VKEADLKIPKKARVEVMNLPTNYQARFLNRVDEIIMFQPLMKSEIRRLLPFSLKT